uniref:Glucosamine-6-phosphate deaminase n=1 Tax=Megaselia scalaris TaxID=36166 RepID=T1H156_MEGSC
MGIGTILAARKTVLVATDSAKVESLVCAIEEPLSACVPASALQLHPDCLIIADQGAASALTQYNII